MTKNLTMTVCSSQRISFQFDVTGIDHGSVIQIKLNQNSLSSL